LKDEGKAGERTSAIGEQKEGKRKERTSIRSDSKREWKRGRKSQWAVLRRSTEP
jgi:hypothetical protein